MNIGPVEFKDVSCLEVGPLLLSGVKCRLSEARRFSGAACDVAQLAWELQAVPSGLISVELQLWITPSLRSDSSSDKLPHGPGRS